MRAHPISSYFVVANNSRMLPRFRLDFLLFVVGSARFCVQSLMFSLSLCRRTAACTIRVVFCTRGDAGAGEDFTFLFTAANVCSTIDFNNMEALLLAAFLFLDVFLGVVVMTAAAAGFVFNAPLFRVRMVLRFIGESGPLMFGGAVSFVSFVSFVFFVSFVSFAFVFDFVEDLFLFVVFFVDFFFALTDATWIGTLVSDSFSDGKACIMADPTDGDTAPAKLFLSDCCCGDTVVVGAAGAAGAVAVVVAVVGVVGTPAAAAVK